MEKSLITSWTFWFGIAQIAMAIFGFLSGNVDQQGAMTLLATGLGTIGLRLKTTGGIGRVM
jgi:hypothetical protein